MTPIVTPQLASIASSTPVAPLEPPQLQALGQMIGQILTGTVIALLNDTTLRLQTPAGFLDVAADAPLPSGTPVTIAVQGTPRQPQIVITPVTSGPQQPPVPQGDVANESTAAQIGTNSAAQNSAAEASATASAPNVAELAEQPNPTARTTVPVTQAALSTAAAIVRNAAATQGSLGALYADLEAAVGTPTPSLPAPVLDAAKSLLAMRLDMTSGRTIDADEVRTALVQSGVASALPAPASPVLASPAPAAEPTDVGAALVALRQALNDWLDHEPSTNTAAPAAAAPSPAPPQSPRAKAPLPLYRALSSLAQAPLPPSLPAATPPRAQAVHALAQVPSNSQAPLAPETSATPQTPARANVPMPPFRGAPALPQAPVPAALSPTASPREQAVHLLAQTDAAIARQTLLRVVSLPGGQSSSTTHRNDNSTRVMFEIPVATAFGTGIAPMTIARDGGKGDAAEGLASWIANFSIDLAALGPVHVRIALVGERASVTFSAEHTQSAELLAADLPLLDAGLRGAQIEPGDLRCRVGSAGNAAQSPDGATRSQAAAPGLFLDQAS
jgi:flagellar hook-length control protein FliK